MPCRVRAKPMWMVWITEAMRAVPMCLPMALPPHEESQGQNPVFPKPKRPTDYIGLRKLRTRRERKDIILSCRGAVGKWTSAPICNQSGLARTNDWLLAATDTDRLAAKRLCSQDKEGRA